MSRTPIERLAEVVAHFDAMHRRLERGSIDDETIADAASLRLAAAIDALHRGAPELTTELFRDEWPVIWGMRNRIARGYAWTDIETVKATVDQDLPAVEAAVRGLFAQLQVAREEQ